MNNINLELCEIPGVGPSISKDLVDVGIYQTSDLRDKDPEQLYKQLVKLRGTAIDRCVLYVFRCAVYFAQHTQHDPDLLKWWNWKDR